MVTKKSAKKKAEPKATGPKAKPEMKVVKPPRATGKNTTDEKPEDLGKGYRPEPPAGGDKRLTTDELLDQMPQKKRIAGQVTIEKVKLGKKGLIVNLSVLEKDGSITREPGRASTRPVHPDLKAAMSAFAIHWALLLGFVRQVNIKDIKNYDPELVEDITISGITITGEDGDEGIIITGQKYTARKKSFNTNTPLERFEEVQETRYKFMDDVVELKDKLFAEVQDYISGKKVGEEEQGSLFPGNTDDEPGEEDF